ncbi:hypothetical protein PRZ61_03070 [Halomonas pacifica]|uniref:DUF2768 domain-containing protein n=1 Tax=Bisbaumannia pacifica TaxID=77098 RepID=A0A510X7C2_9GAMM|nr:hypothetical protein [Halomonas pacifica]MBH8580054.1 hypothetical protein [Halomonas pacifica]MDC8802436.1 hypothetical protein [Halomonas pacifica]GEK46355.1 hypothetical protein HPA02_06380 [Halomonas pacifica]
MAESLASAAMFVIFVAAWLGISIALGRRGQPWLLRQLLAMGLAFGLAMAFVAVLLWLGVIGDPA